MVNSIFYGLVHKGKLVEIYARLPKRIRLEDGMSRTNLEQYSKEELQKLGLYTLFDTQPAYNPESACLELKGYNILKDRIVSEYVVRRNRLNYNN